MPSMMMNALETVDVSIPSGQSVSSSMDLSGLRLFCLLMPASWTSANVSFQVSYDGGVNWANLYDADGNEVVAVVSAGNCVTLDPPTFAAVPFIRLRSGTSATSVAQEGDRSLKLVLRSV